MRHHYEGGKQLASKVPRALCQGPTASISSDSSMQSVLTSHSNGAQAHKDLALHHGCLLLPHLRLHCVQSPAFLPTWSVVRTTPTVSVVLLGNAAHGIMKWSIRPNYSGHLHLKGQHRLCCGNNHRYRAVLYPRTMLRLFDNTVLLMPWRLAWI